MNPQQEKRYAKLRTEHFYLLGQDNDDKGNILYHISGSTRNVYTVTVYPADAKIFCSCPDAKSWAARYNCVCKHSLFILYRVLQVFDRTDHPFFDRLQFTPLELECIQLSTEYLQAHIDATVVKDDLTRRFKNLNRKSEDMNEEQVTMRFDADDLCGVCFLELDEGSQASTTKYMTCPQCKKTAHQDCIEKWISSGHRLCVYCRQDVWSAHNQKTKTNGDYENLGY